MKIKELEVGDSPQNFIPLPDPKNPAPGVDIVCQYPEELQKLMDADVKNAIRDTSTMSASLTRSFNGEYLISAAKLKRAPYDGYLHRLSSKYGINQDFRGGPKLLTHSLRGRLKANVEYIFALVKDGETSKILLLPRTEVMLINGKYYEGRHTHREFLFGRDDNGLLAAGTMYVDPYNISFNFRTGHFMVQMERPEVLALIRRTILEAVSFANDKTLPNSRPLYSQLVKTKLEYTSNDKPSHSVEQELSASKHVVKL